MFEQHELKILDIDSDGQATAKIINFSEIIKINFDKKNIVFNKGDIVSALIKSNKKKIIKVKVIKKLNIYSPFFVTVIKVNSQYLTVKKLSRKIDDIYAVPLKNVEETYIKKIKIGSLVRVKEVIKKDSKIKNNFLKQCDLLQVYGGLNEFDFFSLMTIDEFHIDSEFSKQELEEANKLTFLKDNSRLNLKKLPIVTIDGKNAKDFDDAVYAERLNNKNWKVIVSIADVSFYVKENSLLDEKAKKRGNSIYLPNMVIPMFPEIISNQLCSLNEKESKLCISVEIILNNKGEKLSHKFFKSTISSKKRLNYDEVQRLIDSNFDTNILKNSDLNLNIKNLYKVYKILKKKSEKISLDLNIDEKIISFDEKGKPYKVKKMYQQESNKLIEELMILANICAAEEVQKYEKENVYRVHQKPSQEKINSLIKSIGKPYDKILKNNPVTPSTFNLILKNNKNLNEIDTLNQLILRAQSQAKYNSINIGHFGLGLKNYVHFTSPIRRYSDLIIHRKLNSIIENNTLKNDNNFDLLKETCDHISQTERNAISAERKTFDRFSTYIYSNKKKKSFDGKIISIKKFGIFVSFDNNLVEGLILKKHLPRDNYIYDHKKEILKGIQNKIIFELGKKLKVSIRETDIINGKILLNFINYV
tara:strand:- start:225 stop:2162 length:1938 start_codon:yes stop_codon:yes gene_type:complete